MPENKTSKELLASFERKEAFYKQRIIELEERIARLESNERQDGKFRILFDKANDAIFTMQNGRFIDCNSTTLELYRCTREEVIGRSPAVFAPVLQPNGELSRALSLQYYDKALDGEPQHFDWLHQRLDKSLFHAEISLTRFNVQEDVYVLCVVRDISKRKLAEETILKQKEELKEYSKNLEEKVLERTTELEKTVLGLKERELDLKNHLTAIDQSAGRIAFDNQGKILYANSLFRRMTGTTIKELENTLIEDIFSGQSNDMEECQILLSSVKRGNPYRGVHQYTIKNQNFWFFATYTPIKDIHGNVTSILALYNDISKVRHQELLLREQAEELQTREEELKQNLEELSVIQEVLEASKKRFEDLANLLPQAIYETDPGGNITYLNQHGYQLLDLTEEDLAKGFNAVQTVIPEDRPRIMENIGRIVQGSASEGNEYSVLTKSGKTIPIIMYSSLLEKDGQPAGLRGVAVDVSMLKTAEKKIKHQLGKIELQKQEIEMQHEELTAQHNTTQSSINYAKRIQESVLPNVQDIFDVFDDCFILYQPRDIVSGDFYWMRPREEDILFAVADCTGHGVPGAFMSLLSVSLLNEIANTFENISPAMILEEMRKSVIRILKQSVAEYDNRDGLDIAICQFNQTDEITFAGANIGCLQYQKGKLIEHQPDKMPVGFHYKQNDYTEKTIQYKRGDILYMFSDGYKDQIGEKTFRRMKSWRFKEKLEEVAPVPMLQQKNQLYNFFKSWRGAYEQVDDVLVVGIKL
jgi:PAS domain S-box-containing protein